MTGSWTHARHPVTKALRSAAMAYPQTVEDLPWGHPAYKVAGKRAFLFLGGDEASGLTCSIKLPFRCAEAIDLHGAAPTGYGLGKSGWVTFCFGPKAKPSLAMLTDYLDESWRAVAPKKLSAGFAPPAPLKSRKGG